MNLRLLILILSVLGLGHPPASSLWAQPASPAKTPPQAYLRYLCAADGNVPPKVFGEWPQFQPPRRLAVEGGPGGPLLLTSQLLPLSSGGYQPVTLAPGKIVIQELSADPANKTPPKTLASLNFQPKANRFYTLLIRGEASAPKLEVLEDEPAVLPPAKEGEEPPPPAVLSAAWCWNRESGCKFPVPTPESNFRPDRTSRWWPKISARVFGAWN